MQDKDNFLARSADSFDRLMRRKAQPCQPPEPTKFDHWIESEHSVRFRGRQYNITNEQWLAPLLFGGLFLLVFLFGVASL